MHVLIRDVFCFGQSDNELNRRCDNNPRRL